MVILFGGNLNYQFDGRQQDYTLELRPGMAVATSSKRARVGAAPDVVKELNSRFLAHGFGTALLTALVSLSDHCDPVAVDAHEHVRHIPPETRALFKVLIRDHPDIVQGRVFLLGDGTVVTIPPGVFGLPIVPSHVLRHGRFPGDTPDEVSCEVLWTTNNLDFAGVCVHWKPAVAAEFSFALGQLFEAGKAAVPGLRVEGPMPPPSILSDLLGWNAYAGQFILRCDALDAPRELRMKLEGLGVARHFVFKEWTMRTSMLEVAEWVVEECRRCLEPDFVRIVFCAWNIVDANPQELIVGPAELHLPLFEFAKRFRIKPGIRAYTLDVDIGMLSPELHGGVPCQFPRPEYLAQVGTIARHVADSAAGLREAQDKAGIRPCTLETVLEGLERLVRDNTRMVLSGGKPLVALSEALKATGEQLEACAHILETQTDASTVTHTMSHIARLDESMRCLVTAWCESQHHLCFPRLAVTTAGDSFIVM